MIRHDYAAKHDAAKRPAARRNSKLKKAWAKAKRSAAAAWRFLSHKDPVAGESILGATAAGLMTIGLMVSIFVLAVLVGGE